MTKFATDVQADRKVQMVKTTRSLFASDRSSSPFSLLIGF